MYNLDTFRKCNINPTWQDIYYGVKYNYLDKNSVSEFALSYIEQNVELEEVWELAWKNNEKDYILNKIENIIGTNFNEQASETRWKYCIVKDIIEKYKDFDILAEKLDEVYADFNYPEDMEDFVSYMPVKDMYDVDKHTIRDNQERIIKKAKEFLEDKRKVLE